MDNRAIGFKCDLRDSWLTGITKTQEDFRDDAERQEMLEWVIANRRKAAYPTWCPLVIKRVKKTRE
jgi:hypothetical protein